MIDNIERNKIPFLNLAAGIKRCIECGKDLTGIYVSNIYKPGYAKCLGCGLGAERIKSQP